MLRKKGGRRVVGGGPICHTCVATNWKRRDTFRIGDTHSKGFQRKKLEIPTSSHM